MFLDLIFNLIHLFIVLLIFVYIFIKFILPKIKSDILNKNNYLNKLVYDKNKSIELQKCIDFETEMQDVKCQDIQSKINLWIDSNRKISSDKLESEKALYEMLFNKVAEQSQAYEKEMLLKRLMPVVLDQLESKLITHFNNSINGSKYVSKILDNISPDFYRK